MSSGSHTQVCVHSRQASTACGRVPYSLLSLVLGRSESTTVPGGDFATATVHRHCGDNGVGEQRQQRGRRPADNNIKKQKEPATTGQARAMSVVGAHAVAFVAAVVALHCCRRCACAPGRPRVMRRAIVEMMERDELFADVLAESVVLHDGAEGVPAWAKEELRAHGATGEAVDPLSVIRRLVTPSGHQSGRDMTLAAAVLGAAVRCFMYKRVAVHVALAARMLAMGADQKTAIDRVAMMDDVLLRTVDMLVALGAPHDELLVLFARTAKHATAQWYNSDELVAALNDGAGTLHGAIGYTCKVADLPGYVHELGLKADPGAASPEPEAAGEQRVADSVPLDTVVNMLRSSENAILDAHERMYMLRAADMAVWRALFDYPDLPADDPKAFERTPAARYRDVVVKKMDRAAKKEAVVRREVERLDAAMKAAKVVPYEERDVPIEIS